jgi:hypothetical protein
MMEVGTSVGWFFDFGKNLSILFFENLQNLRTSSFGSLMFQDSNNLWFWVPENLQEIGGPNEITSLLG